MKYCRHVAVLTLALVALSLLLYRAPTNAQKQTETPSPTPTPSIGELQALVDRAGYDWTVGETSVSNLTAKEQRRLLGLATDGMVTIAGDEYCFVSSYPHDYPAALDWRDRYGHDWTTAIRNQGQCGSCSAFATAAALESRLKIAHDNSGWWPDLSEAHIFFCDSGDCSIGMDPIFALIDAQSRGVVDEACYPYQPCNQSCSPCADWESRVTKIDCFRRSNGDDRIKQELADYGPLVTAMDVYDDFHSYAGGVYAHAWGDYSGAHAVALVGYNDSGGYWIAKNSWGTNWGESGWFRIAYGQCGIGEYGFVSVVDRTPPGQATDLRPWVWTGPYTNDPTPSFTWTRASDDWGGIGLDGYYIAIDDATPEGGYGNDWSIEKLTSWTVPVELPDGAHFVALTSRDKAGNVNPTNTNHKGDAIYYDFVVDLTSPAGATNLKVNGLSVHGDSDGNGVADGNYINDTTPTFTWSRGSDAMSGIEGQWASLSDWTPEQGDIELGATATSYTSGPLSDGSHFFAIGTEDKAGNRDIPNAGSHAGAGTHIHFYVDTAAPNSAVSGLPSTTAPAVTVSWSGSDTGSGVTVYDVQVRDGVNGDWQDWLTGITRTAATFTGVEKHTYYFRSRAQDDAGNWESYPTSPDYDAYTTVQSQSSTHTIGGYVLNASGDGIAGVTVDFGGARPAVTTNSSGYYAQSGFSDGNYTVSFSHSGYTFSPVLDQVTVSSADAIHSATGYSINSVSLPFSDGFEGGTLGDAWTVETDYEGRVRVGDNESPHGGRYTLLLDDDTPGGFYSHASAILTLDLSGHSQVELSFWWREFADEDHADDGVFISDDNGQSWHRVFSFNGTTSTFVQTVVDLDDQASDAGLSLNDCFLIKFQFYDNYSIGADGYSLDDVQVYDPATKYQNYLPIVLK